MIVAEYQATYEWLFLLPFNASKGLSKADKTTIFSSCRAATPPSRGLRSDDEP